MASSFIYSTLFYCMRTPQHPVKPGAYLAGAPQRCVVGGLTNGDERLLSPHLHPHSHRLIVVIFTLPGWGGGVRQEEEEAQVTAQPLDAVEADLRGSPGRGECSWQDGDSAPRSRASASPGTQFCPGWRVPESGIHY